MTRINRYQVTTVLLICILQAPFILATCPTDCICTESRMNNVLKVICREITVLEDRLETLPKNRPKVELDVKSVIKIEQDAFLGLRHVTHFSITARTLQFLHHEVFREMIHLEKLVIRFTLIQTINLNMFANLQNLIVLAITHNHRLESYGDSDFPYLPKLESVDLTNNIQLDINNELFINLKNIKVLTLNAMAISELKEGYFSQSTELRELYLSHNMIENIDDKSFKDLHKLQILDLGSNLLKSITESLFSSLTKIELLELSDNLLDSFPKQLISHMSHLKVLRLSKNMIKYIDHDLLYNNELLVELSLDKNELTSIYSDLFQYSRKIRIINFGWNNIMDIPKNEFHNLKELRMLRLNHNKISALVPGLFSGLDVLHHLDLSHNRISFNNLDNEGIIRKGHNTTNCNNSKNVYFNDNNVTSSENASMVATTNCTDINKKDEHFVHGKMITTSKKTEEIIGYFSGLPKINMLRLHNNHISFLPKSIFYGLDSLRMLNVAYNKIESLKDILVCLSSINAIFANNNNITSLDENTFSGQTQIGVINVRNNQISFIHPHVFSTIEKKMSKIDLRGNNLPCSCYTLELLQDYAWNLKLDCILKENRLNSREISCDKLTMKWQQLYLAFDKRNSNIDSLYIERPGKEFIITFNLKLIETNLIEQKLFLHFKSKLGIISNYDYIHIVNTNNTIYTSMNQDETFENISYERLKGENEVSIKVVHEKELLNSRLTIFINKRAIASLKTYFEKEYDQIIISLDKSYQEKYGIHDIKCFTSRCLFVKQSCVSVDGINSTKCKCEDFENRFSKTIYRITSTNSIGESLSFDIFVLMASLMCFWTCFDVLG